MENNRSPMENNYIFDTQLFKQFIELNISYLPKRADAIKKEELLAALTQFKELPAVYLKRNTVSFNVLLKQVFKLDKPSSMSYQNYLLYLYKHKQCNKCICILPHTSFFADKQRWDKLTYYCKSCSKEYAKNNIGNIRLTKKKYKNSILYNTPKWLTEAMLFEITCMYREAQRLSRVTGEQYDVDHIVPLRGKTVCGLHVPWNLQILKHTENMKKSNKHENT
jgi:hypothetical protein